jgi:Transposase, Mutator family
LKGVVLVVSDAHEGLKQAIAKVLHGTSWQRCRVHFMRNLLVTVPRSASGAVAAIVRTVFAQLDHPSALSQLNRVADGLRPRFATAAEVLEEAAEDVLAFMHFPEEHRRRLHSTNPLERLHKDVKRRTPVVGIFPDRASLIRLAGMLLAEQDDEWAVTDSRYVHVRVDGSDPRAGRRWRQGAFGGDRVGEDGDEKGAIPRTGPSEARRALSGEQVGIWVPDSARTNAGLKVHNLTDRTRWRAEHQVTFARPVPCSPVTATRGRLSSTTGQFFGSTKQLSLLRLSIRKGRAEPLPGRQLDIVETWATATGSS